MTYPCLMSSNQVNLTPGNEPVLKSQEKTSD